MSRKITALAIAILVTACSIVMVGHSNNDVVEVSSAKVNSYAANETVDTNVMSYIPTITLKGPNTTTLDQFVSEKLDYVTIANGILGDVSEIGDSIGGIIGSNDTDTTSSDFVTDSETPGTGGVVTNVVDMPVEDELPGGSGIGSGIGSIIGGGLGSVDLGGAISGIGGALGGIVGGIGNGGVSSPNSGVTYDVNTETNPYIDVVPAATDYVTVTQAVQASIPLTTFSENLNETVDFAADNNPYNRPTTTLKGGDTGEGVKWMQWIFIYTRYGLKDDGITGIFDEDTMAVVKKLQKENGFTVDGIVDDEVIDKIELLYFQAIHSTTEEEVQTTVEQTTAPAEEKSGLSGGLTALLVAVIIIWIIVIGFLVTMFILKKKKLNEKKAKTSEEKVKNVAAETPVTYETTDVSNSENFTVEQMFEDEKTE